MIRSLLLLVLVACGEAPSAPIAIPPPPPPSAISSSVPSSTVAVVSSPTSTSTSDPTSTSTSTPTSTSIPTSTPTAPDAGAPRLSCTRYALSIVLDRSGSMSGLPMDMARSGARDAIAAVANGDCAEVIAFDSTPTRVVAMQPLPATRDKIFAAILAIQPGGGTEIFAALDMAHTDIAATPATRKHVVLVTDGQSPVNWLKELVRDMAAGGTTTSTIALGGSTDEKLLQSLASDGGGRFYKVPDPKTLPKIMVKEVALGAK